jgi:hypothetical protein
METDENSKTDPIKGNTEINKNDIEKNIRDEGVKNNQLNNIIVCGDNRFFTL